MQYHDNNTKWDPKSSSYKKLKAELKPNPSSMNGELILEKNIHERYRADPRKENVQGECMLEF